MGYVEGYMAGARRQAQNPIAWEHMYRDGLPASGIAELAGAAETTVRGHLQMAIGSDPSIHEEHLKAAALSGTGQDSPALRSLEEVVALYRAEGRLPSGNAKSARERALRSWLSNRRRESAAGTLSRLYRDRLQEIPGWDAPSGQSEKYEALWNERLIELVGYWAANQEWPSDKNPGSEEERLLGVWLRSQRANHRHGQLRSDREAQLDAKLPGWRLGWPSKGGRPNPSTPATGDRNDT